MKSRTWFFVVVVVALLLPGTLSAPARAQSVLYYVTPSGTGGCTSWADACGLQAALALAGAGGEVWVAEGTHFPTADTERTAAFQLASGVALYGGFEGWETSREQRDWVAENRPQFIGAATGAVMTAIQKHGEEKAGS